MKRRTPLPLLAVPLLVAACGFVHVPWLPPSEPLDLEGLAGRTFIATDTTPRALVPGTTIRLTFRDDGTLGVSAGCNQIGADWRLDGTTLRATGGGMTEMGCDPDRHAQDEWLVDVLTSNPTVTLEGANLTLTADGTAIQLIDREVAEPDQALTGVPWVLDGMRSGDAVASVPNDVRATIRIEADGSIAVATGCNEGGGRAIIDGNTLRIEDLAVTEIGCEADAAATERAVLEVLGTDPVTWSVDGEALVLDAGDVGLILRAG